MGLGLDFHSHRPRAAGAISLAAILALSACGRGPAAIPARDHDASLSAAPAVAAPGTSSGEDRADPDLRVATTREDPRDAQIPLFHGRPMWAANRRHTAEENARYQFARDGADFGARDVDDFVAKAHAFVDRPPHGTLTLTRDNGDRLLYDPATNVFAVVSRDGAPRTMFKPRDGAAYWREQKDRLADAASSGGSRRYGGRGRSRSGDDASDDQG
jgi:pyocin large subunit-like protein